MIGGLNLNTFNSWIQDSSSVLPGIIACVLMILFQVVEVGRIDLISAGGLAGEATGCIMELNVIELKIQGSNATRAIT